MSKRVNEHWPYNPVEPGYLRTRPTPPTLVEQFLFASLYHISIPGRAVPLYTPHQGSELLRVTRSFKRGRESRARHSAVPSAAVLFVVLVVVGPSDLGLCLTGALHYSLLRVTFVRVPALRSIAVNPSQSKIQIVGAKLASASDAGTD